MASFIQDLELAEVILGDVAAFASGKPLSATKSFGDETVAFQAVILPSGRTGTPYTVFSGSIWEIFALVVGDAAALAAGAPLQIAEKLGNTWYGISIQVMPKSSAPAAA